MKQSPQRELIYQTILGHPVHPTVDEIFQMVRKEMPNIGIATVYRNVSYLYEKHMVRRLSGADGVDRYDASTEDHPHFYCLECKRFLDYPMDSYQAITNVIRQDQEFQVTDIDFVVKGRCKDCH